MSSREPTETINLDTQHGNAALPWSRARDLLDRNALNEIGTSWLGTVRPDGRPHSAGVGAAWYDGDVFFQAGPNTRKARNVAQNPACTVSVSLPGIDVVFEGDAARVTDPETLEAIASIYREGGWPVQVEGDAFNAPYMAPGGGPPPWHLFRIAVHTAFGVAGKEPHGATRWRF